MRALSGDASRVRRPRSSIEKSLLLTSLLPAVQKMREAGKNSRLMLMRRRECSATTSVMGGTKEGW